jgi:hypothetical protein
MLRKVLPFIVAAGMLGCSNKDNIPAATGVSGSIYVIMDSIQWRGRLGRTLDSIFSAEMPGLPRTEPIFKFRWINPAKLNYVLKQSRNMIFVLTLDQNTQGSRIVQKLFTKESIEKVKANPTQFMTSTMNVFAKGQEIMYLYGPDEETLLRNVKANAKRLVEHFNQKEKERMSSGLYKGGQVTGVSDILVKEFRCDIKIPFGYKLALKEPDFVWLRQINPRDDKDVFIARKPYSSQEDFKRANLIKFRDDVCRTHLFEDPDRQDTYLLTEMAIPFAPVVADTLTFNGKFAVRLRGLWRSNTLQMGGPFESIALVDEGTNMFYYIEGFTFSPGKDQREIMRELETILFTFRTSDQLRP